MATSKTRTTPAAKPSSTRAVAAKPGATAKMVRSASKTVSARQKAASKPKRRVFSISVPPEMAAQVEKAAKAQNCTISEYFRDVLRERNRAALQEGLERLYRIADSRPKPDVTQDDIEAWVDEVRGEMYRERMAQE